MELFCAFEAIAGGRREYRVVISDEELWSLLNPALYNDPVVQGLLQTIARMSKCISSEVNE